MTGAGNGNDPFTPMAAAMRLALDDWSAAWTRPRHRPPDLWRLAMATAVRLTLNIWSFTFLRSPQQVAR
jgi:hypothetical protein